MKKSTKVKIFSIIGFVIFFFLLMLFLLSDENVEIIKSVFSDEVSSDEVHDVLHGLGIRGYATVSILAMLQVILTFLPAEPVQVIGSKFALFKRNPQNPKIELVKASKKK